MMAILTLFVAGGKVPQATSAAGVETGLERLLEAEDLSGKTVGLIVDHTAVDRYGRHLADLLLYRGIRVGAIFSPEHGFAGHVPDGATVSDSSYRGVPIHSLYGATFAPSPDELAGLDILIYDLQDVGARFFTYISTLGLCLEASASAGIPFLVLDRPNPIGGEVIEGPVLEPEFRSFVGRYPIPIRYGLTAGELARMMIGEGWLGSPQAPPPSADRPELRVIEMRGWRRDMTYEKTGLPWLKPSPNMTTALTALVYPGMCLVEGTNVSEGRGTELPFIQAGAPWLDGEAAARELNAQKLPGVKFDAVVFTPRAIPGVVDKPKYKDIPCRGVRLWVTDRETFVPVLAGVTVLSVICRLHRDDFRWRETFFDRLAGAGTLRPAIEAGVDPSAIVSSWREKLLTYDRLRNKYLLY